MIKDIEELKKIIKNIDFNIIPVINGKRKGKSGPKSTFHNGVLSLLFLKGIELGYLIHFERPTQIEARYKNKQGNRVRNAGRVDMAWKDNIKKYKRGVNGKDLVWFEVDTEISSKRSLKKFRDSPLQPKFKVNIKMKGFLQKYKKKIKPIFETKKNSDVLFVHFG